MEYDRKALREQGEVTVRGEYRKLSADGHGTDQRAFGVTFKHCEWGCGGC